MVYSDFSLRLHDFLSSDRNIATKNPVKRLVVAYSGGVDSSVLLYLCKTFCDQEQYKNANGQPLELLAIHINHGLSDQSTHWENHCQTRCDSLNCELIIRSVALQKENAIEEQARSLRYQVFSDLCAPGDLLLTAHHLYDQSETLLFRFLRGAGSNGLKGIPDHRYLDDSLDSDHKIIVYRPLLSTDKKSILEYAQQEGLAWVEDESNQRDTFSRNFIRQKVLPLLRNRWPELDNNLNRSAKFFIENEILLSDLAELDLKNCFNNSEHLLKWGDSLDLKYFYHLSLERQKNILRHWIKRTGNHLPHEKRLLNLLSFCEGYQREGAGEVTWQDGNNVLVFRVFAAHLFFHIYSSNGFIEIQSEHEPLVWHYKHKSEIDWQGYRYRIQVMPANYDIDDASSTVLYLPDDTLTLKMRQGGERCRPVGRQHSQTLKKLFQEYDIPSWERDSAAIFYHDSEIVAVSDFWSCTNTAASERQPEKPLQESAWVISRERINSFGT